MHDDGLAVLHVRAGAVQVPGGEALDLEGEGSLVAQAVRDRCEPALLHGDARGVATPLAERHHALPGVEPHAGDLRTRDQWEVVLVDVLVLARVRVGEVQAGERDVDEHLAGCRYRIGELDQLEHLRPTELPLQDRAHGRQR